MAGTTISLAATIAATILLAAIATVTAVNRPPNSICDSHPVNYFVRDVRQCNAFFRCNQRGVAPTWGTCQTQGSVFNEALQRCVWASEFQCFACPTNRLYALLPVETTCSHYIQCIDGEAQQFECAPGLHFDAQRNVCDLQERARCGAPTVSIQCPAVDQPHNRMWWRDAQDCSRYAVCVRGQAQRSACAQGLGFNMRTQQCDHRANAGCTDGGGVVVPTPQPPREFSCAEVEPLAMPIYPHPTDCTRYFICDEQNNEFPRQCPPDTRFDIVQQRCDSLDRAVCAPGARLVRAANGEVEEVKENEEEMPEEPVA